MSYSFTVRAATRVEVKGLVQAKLAEVLDQQPAHEIDAEQAFAAACAFIDLVPEDSELYLQVSVNGSVSWSGTWGVDPRVSGVAVFVSCYQVTRVAPA